MNKMPMDGMRVIDLGRTWSAPLVARLLGDFGAEVIKVEILPARGQWSGPMALPKRAPGDFPDLDPGKRPWNRYGMFNDLNRNKLSLTLNLDVPISREIFKRLVRLSDVVVDNYTPRVMANFGLDYAVLKTVKEDIIVLSISGFGNTGPYRDYPAFGITTEPVSGLTHLMGYPGGPQGQFGVAYGDPIAALHGAGAVLVALWHRHQTGRGQYIDLSMCETGTSVIGEIAVGYSMNKKIPPHRGNRHPYSVPHGCYRCRGNDKWVVIAVSSDEEWEAFYRAIGSPPWSRNKKFSNQLSRWENQDELDRLIEEWTIQHEHYEVMHILQTMGVTSGPVLNGIEILNDPHLRARNFFVEIAHPEAGTHPYAGVPMKLSKTPATFRLSAPCLGEHNDYVLSELLGLSKEEIAQLKESEAMGITLPEMRES